VARLGPNLYKRRGFRTFGINTGGFFFSATRAVVALSDSASSLGGRSPGRLGREWGGTVRSGAMQNVGGARFATDAGCFGAGGALAPFPFSGQTAGPNQTFSRTSRGRGLLVTECSQSRKMMSSDTGPCSAFSLRGGPKGPLATTAKPRSGA